MRYCRRQGRSPPVLVSRSPAPQLLDGPAMLHLAILALGVRLRRLPVHLPTLRIQDRHLRFRRLRRRPMPVLLRRSHFPTICRPAPALRRRPRRSIVRRCVKNLPRPPAVLLHLLLPILAPIQLLLLWARGPAEVALATGLGTGLEAGLLSGAVSALALRGLSDVALETGLGAGLETGL